jgi:hypothetical protein
MRVFRWVLAFVAALIGFTIGLVGLFLLTRAVIPSAGVPHFWGMFTASLLAIYAGSVTVQSRDRMVGLLVFATVVVGYSAFFLLVGLIGHHAFGQNAYEFFGACSGAAFAVKITPGRKEAAIPAYSGRNWR